ncbi:MAG: hypothetical protein ABSH03_22350 [Candidatus Lustribacter sp.]|jgi:hypothetical protein
MKQFVLTAAVIAALASPSFANAQMVAASHMAGAPEICRAAKAGETANATMGSSQLICHPVNVARVMAAEKTLMSMMAPNMTADQMKKAHAAQMTMSTELMLPMIPGTNGNPSN